MKKKISVILAVAIVLSSIVCFNQLSAYGATSGTCSATGSSVKFSYDTTAKKLTITGTGSIKNYGTTNLNKTPWYDYREEIQSVEIGEGVTSIGQLAFFYCTSLTSVTLPSTLTQISGGTANYGAFRDCISLESITLPDGLTTIGAMAFRGCTSLKSISFPDSLTSLGNYAFQDCTALTSVVYGNGLSESGPYAFYESGVKSVRFSSSITQISEYSFFGTRFTTVELPEQITSIGTRAFANCSFMTTVTVNNSDCEYKGIIGEDPFNGSSQSITFYGHSGSTTQTYASEKGYNFISLDPCNHETTHEVITLEATCTDTGVTTQVCDNCGFVVSTATIPAKGHTYELVSEIDETEQNGHIYKDYRCVDCQDEYSEITHVANVEGFYDYTNTATCTRTGIETYTCTLEGCGNVDRKVSPKGNHTIEEYTVIAEPTCTQDGSREGVCTVCQQTVTETIKATGHTNEFVETLDNTAEDGHTYEILQCSVCGEQTVTPTHVEWLDGYYTSTVITNPTCTINGVQRDKCNVCSQSRNVSIPANGQHVWYETSRTEPTCTAVGKIYYACENCNMTKSENIDALGHSYELVPDSCVEATCTTAGYNTSKCSVCNSVKRDVISATGHTVDEAAYHITKEPDCENQGKAESVCSVCGAELLDLSVDALGHDYKEIIVPIEEKPGHSLLTPTCARCGSTDTSEVVHFTWMDEYTNVQVVSEGSCTVARVVRTSCTLCDESYTTTNDAPGHNYSYTSTNDSGNLIYTCANCNGTISRTPATVILAWRAQYINNVTDNITNGYLFELTGDNVINAKDYSMLIKARSAYQQANQ